MLGGFTTKGYGRIYVDKEENIEKVKNIIKLIDEYEYDGYFPKDLVALFSEYPKVVYTHKFDAIDLNELTARCWENGIYVFCLDNGHYECIVDYKGISF